MPAPRSQSLATGNQLLDKVSELLLELVGNLFIGKSQPVMRVRPEVFINRGSALGQKVWSSLSPRAWFPGPAAFPPREEGPSFCSQAPAACGPDHWACISLTPVDLGNQIYTGVEIHADLSTKGMRPLTAPLGLHLASIYTYTFRLVPVKG